MCLCEGKKDERKNALAALQGTGLRVSLWLAILLCRLTYVGVFLLTRIPRSNCRFAQISVLSTGGQEIRLSVPALIYIYIYILLYIDMCVYIYSE